MITEVFRQVETQTFPAGLAAITGVLPTGVDSGQTYLRGAYRKFTNCPLGGRFIQPMDTAVNDSLSGSIRSICWSLPGCSAIVFNWVDMDGVTIPIWPLAGAVIPVSGSHDWQQPIIVPPRGYLQVTCTGPIGAAGGAIKVDWGFGFSQDIFQQFNALGAFSLP